MFYCAEINGKKVIKSDIIKAEHFFTTREFCIKSKEPDMQEVVAQNKQELCDYLNITYDNLISPSQTHTSNIDIVSSNKKEYPETDGLILDNCERGIFLNFADCTPIIIYDEVLNIGAVIHAGWRGTAKNIASKAVNKLIKEYSSDVNNISAAIGPAIGFCCYKVRQDVYESLSATVKDFSGLSEIRSGDIYVDLKSINARQLKECGVMKIDISPYCSCCNNDLFFSYRRENGTTNRHSAVLKLS